MALDRLTKVDGGGISTTSDYRVGIITATKFVGPIEGDLTGSITATDGTFSGNVTIGGTLTYEDVTNIDSVGIITAQSDIHVGGGVSAVGVGTFGGLDINGDIDVDGHTNLDNVSIAGVTTFSDDVKLTVANGNGILLDKSANQFLINSGTYVRFQNNNEVNTDDGKIGTALFASGLNIVGSQTGSGLGRQIRLYGNLLTDNIRPTADSSHSIGTSSNRFLHAYLDNLDVDGHTNLDNVSVAGVSTFADRVTISGGKDLFMFDNGVIRLGNNSNTSDFQMFHDGSHSRLNNSTGTLYIQNTSTGGAVALSAKTGHNGIVIKEAPVRLYYDNTLRFSTSGVGATVYGNLDVTADIDVDGHTNLDNVSIAGVSTHSEGIFLPDDKKIELGNAAGSGDLQIRHISSTNQNRIESTTGNLMINQLGTGSNISLLATHIYLKNHNNNQTYLHAANFGAVELNYNGTKKFETGNTVNINSNHFEITSGQQLRFDNSNNNRTSEILNDGSSGNSVLTFKTNGGNRWTIDSTGHFIPGTAGAVDIGSASKEIGNVFLADNKKVFLGSYQDFEIHHNGSHAYLTNTNGNLFITNSGSGYSYIDTNYLRIRSSGGGHMVEVNTGGANQGVRLFHAAGASGGGTLITTATGITVDGEVAASQDYPNIRPSLDLNFAATKKLDSRITYTRSGRASFINEHGLVEIVNSNVPRFDHDPVTRECKGLLIEETRTNLITYSNIAGMSSPNLGGSPQVNDTVSNITLPTGEKGTVRRYLANAPGGGGRWGGYSGNANVPKTGSVWVRTVSGTGSAVIDISDGGGKTVNLTEEWQRVTTTYTPSNAYEFFDIYFSSPITIYYWGVQIEEGAFMTSYIPTNNGTATRGVETFVIDGENFTEFYNPIESTILVNYTHDFVTSSQLGTEQRVYRFRAVGGLDTRIDYVSNSGYNPYIAKDGSGVASINNGQSTVFGGGANRTAVRVKENSFASSFNGSTSVEDTSGAWNPTNAITEVYLGSSNNGDSPLNGHIQRFTYYPVGFPNSQLVTLTS